MIGALQGLADCVEQELQAAGSPVCWCAPVPGGQAVWDACDSCGSGCGMAWVALVRVEPYTSFGSPAAVSSCAAAMQAVLRVGVARCLPVEADGSALPPQDSAEAAAQLCADMAAVQRALTCCGLEVAVRGWVAMPVQGGCMGGEWEVLLDLLEV